MRPSLRVRPEDALASFGIPDQRLRDASDISEGSIGDRSKIDVVEPWCYDGWCPPGAHSHDFRNKVRNLWADAKGVGCAAIMPLLLHLGSVLTKNLLLAENHWIGRADICKFRTKTKLSAK